MLPEAHVHYGIRNATTGCYELQIIPLGFHKLPQVFKIEPTQKTDKIKAPSLVRGWQGKWDKRIDLLENN